MSLAAAARNKIGPVIGVGQTAEVFRVGDSEVLKLFYEDIPKSSIARELTAASYALQNGIPTPNVTDTREVANRTGIVFEYCHGPTLEQALLRAPWKVHTMTAEFAELQASINALNSPDLPLKSRDLRRLIRNSAEPSIQHKNNYDQMLNRIPDSDKLCHGDFHMNNVLATPTGLRVIDWAKAAAGNRVFDVAETLFKIKRAVRYRGSKALRRILIYPMAYFVARTYLRSYPELSSGETALIRDLQEPLAFGHRRNHTLSRKEVEQQLRSILRTEGPQTVREKIEEHLRNGDVREEELTKVACILLAEHLPAAARAYGRHALELRGTDQQIIDVLASLDQTLDSGSGVSGRQRKAYSKT